MQEDITWEYPDKIINHFLNPRNVKLVKNPDGVDPAASLSCGDVLKFTLKISKDKKVVGEAFAQELKGVQCILEVL